MPLYLYHGGVPGLRAGDLIEPGHERASHAGCAFCDARARGDAHLGVDGPSQDADRVYASTSRIYAKYYASLYGRGALYRVEPVGELVRSPEDTIETFKAPALRVIAVLERAVLLTWAERRRLMREWTAADRIALPESHVVGREDER
jgi:hypothetical protein